MDEDDGNLSDSSNVSTVVYDYFGLTQDSNSSSVNYSDSDIETVDLSYETFDPDIIFDSEDDEMSGDEDDVLSDASTVLYGEHQPTSQSGTDTEEEAEHHADEEVVQSQKRIKLDEPEVLPIQDVANDSIDEDQKCPICLEIWSNAGEHRLCSLRCGHLFGLKCITQWFNIAQNATARKCPECNTKASKRDIRILYAKRLLPIDTSEIEKLKEQLKEASSKKELIEKDIKQYQTREMLYKQEINNLKVKVYELEKTVKSISNGHIFGAQCEKNSLRKSKVIDICHNSSCRVMAYNPWHKILIASSGSAINRIFMDTISSSLNNNIHGGSIRDLAFQEQHPNILLSVGFDKRIILTDIRNNLLTHSYQEETNLWSCCWSNYCNQTFFVGGARGNITEYDIRFLQSGVSIKENVEDRSPVVSLASVPVTSPALRAGGYLACQLNSCYAYSFKEGNYVGNQIDFEGPFTSLRYNEKDNHVLLSCRANAKNPSVRHVVCTIEKAEDQIQFNKVHSFNAGGTQKLLSRPCYTNLENDTMVVANNESLNSIVAWSITTGQEAYSLPISESVVDVCSFDCDKTYQAVLTSNKLHLYHHKDSDA